MKNFCQIKITGYFNAPRKLTKLINFIRTEHALILFSARSFSNVLQ